MEFNRAQLKQSVRQSMRGTASRPMLVTLLFGFVVGIGTWLLNTILGGLLTGGVGSLSETALYYVQQGYDMEEAMNIAMLELLRQGPGAIFGAIVGGAVLSIFVILWQSAMNVGYEGYCLSMVRNENPPMGKIFAALPQFGPVLVTRLLTELFLFLWMLLVVLGYAVLLFAAMTAAVLESVALTVILVLVAVVYLVLGIIWVSMRYVLVDYVLLDKGLSGLEAIRENKRLMKGNIGKAFVLQLSFIGWYLLEGVIVWVGVIFAVLPIIAAAGSMSTVTGTGNMGGLLAASGFALLVLAAVAIGATVLNLWLKPYVTGAMAKFYDWASGRPEILSGGPNFHGGSGGWSEHQNYTWNAGPSSGTGTGSGPRSDVPAPKPPKPKDDPWN